MTAQGLLIKSLPSLVTRITLAVVFLQSGYGKLTHLPRTIEFFTSLGIPLPGVQAPLVALVEFLCGGMLLLGFGTRYASAPLVGVMGVAILTTKGEELASITGLFEVSEFLYILLLSWLLALGSGRISLDAYLQKKRKSRPRA